GTGSDARAGGIEDFNLRREVFADAGKEQAKDVAGVGGERVVAELIGRRHRARGGASAGEGRGADGLVQELPGEAVAAGGARRGRAEDHGVVTRGGGLAGEAEDTGIQA